MIDWIDSSNSTDGFSIINGSTPHDTGGVYHLFKQALGVGLFIEQASATVGADGTYFGGHTSNATDVWQVVEAPNPALHSGGNVPSNTLEYLP